MARYRDVGFRLAQVCCAAPLVRLPDRTPMTQLTMLATAVVVSLIALAAGAVAASGGSQRTAMLGTAVFALLLAVALMLFGWVALRASLPA